METGTKCNPKCTDGRHNLKLKSRFRINLNAALDEELRHVRNVRKSWRQTNFLRVLKDPLQVPFQSLIDLDISCGRYDCFRCRSVPFSAYLNAKGSRIVRCAKWESARQFPRISKLLDGSVSVVFASFCLSRRQTWLEC